jgi:hypothetical protein
MNLVHEVADGVVVFIVMLLGFGVLIAQSGEWLASIYPLWLSVITTDGASPKTSHKRWEMPL